MVTVTTRSSSERSEANLTGGELSSALKNFYLKFTSMETITCGSIKFRARACMKAKLRPLSKTPLSLHQGYVAVAGVNSSLQYFFF